MNLFSKKQIRPRLSMKWSFLEEMSPEVRDKWLDDRNGMESQIQNLFEKIREIQTENADLRDQVDKMENSVSDTLRQNGDLRGQLNERKTVDEMKIRTEMDLQAYHRANEKGIQTFDKLMWFAQTLTNKKS
jgi:chromosome segregation ATPase